MLHSEKTMKVENLKKIASKRNWNETIHVILV